jgi:hypothetical protein
MRLLTRLPDREFTEAEVRKAYLHEVGHAFGIAGHSSNRNDIMYFAVSGQQKGDLTDRDIATINYLYQHDSQAMMIGAGQKAVDQVLGSQPSNSSTTLKRSEFSGYCQKIRGK